MARMRDIEKAGKGVEYISVLECRLNLPVKLRDKKTRKVFMATRVSWNGWKPGTVRISETENKWRSVGDFDIVR